MRTELCWEGRPGTAAGIASALREWRLIRFEATEDATPGCDGARYSVTPSLAIFTAVIGANGDVHIPADRLRSALGNAMAGETTVEHEEDRLPGQTYDDG